MNTENTVNIPYRLAIEKAIAEMHLAGVSTRRIENV